MSLLETRPPSAPTAPASAPAGTPRHEPAARRLGRALLSLPGLVVAFAVITALAMEPLHHVDLALQARWVHQVLPGWGHFFQAYLDPIAGQSVDAPILVLVALLVARRHGTWRPLLVAAAAEGAFYAIVGLMKIAFARPAPVRGGGVFFHGGLWRQGWEGISFPSGHTAESVLIYGAIVYLLATYSGVSRCTARVLTGLVVVVALNAAFVSFFLGWHWTTDLVAGWIAGAIALRVIVLGDRWLSRRLAGMGH